MRGKRSKQYRRLMQQYRLTFGFREPYQVLSACKPVLGRAAAIDLGNALLTAKLPPQSTRR